MAGIAVPLDTHRSGSVSYPFGPLLNRPVYHRVNDGPFRAGLSFCSETCF